jgi:CRP-like cAMP-binding protein
VRPEDLKPYDLFASLGDEERAAVADLVEPLDLGAGDQLFLEGQESDGLVLIERGALRVTSKRAGELGVLEAGDALGSLGLVAVGRREVTAVAEGETRVLLLSRESFQRLMLDEPRACCRVLETAICEFSGVARLALDRF